MNILDILVTQRKLKRKDQIEGIIKSIKEGNLIEPIPLLLQSDQSVVCEDGHHRLASHFLSGKNELDDFDYVLLYDDSYKPKFGTIKDLLERTKWTL